MYCISVSYKKTPLNIREHFTFSKEEQSSFLTELMECSAIQGGVILSTCNRSEIYYSGEGSFEHVENVIAKMKKISIEYMKKNCLYYQGKGAVQHLYKVVCGLDSMILGEDEILHQTKEAYLTAEQNGFTNSELNIIFQEAFHCAKISKSETQLSNTPVSIGTITANVIEDYRKQQRDVLNNRSKVLVVGATGKIASIVAKDLVAKGISVIATTRSHPNMGGVYLSEDKHMDWIGFSSRYEVLKEVYAVVSATASPHYTLTKDAFIDVIDEKEYEKGYLLVDLAVPHDIDGELGKLSNIRLLDIDYFKNLSKDNRNIRLGEHEKVEMILMECVEEVLKKIYIRDFRERIGGKLEENWFSKMVYYLKEVLDSEQLKNVLNKIYENEMEER